MIGMKNKEEFSYKIITNFSLINWRFYCDLTENDGEFKRMEIPKQEKEYEKNRNDYIKHDVKYIRTKRKRQGGIKFAHPIFSKTPNIF